MCNSLKLLAPISLIVALAACSNEESAEESAVGGEYAPASVEEAGAAADAAEDAVAEMGLPPPTQANRSAGGEDAPPMPPSQIPVSLPKMAYVMNYGFRLGGEKIATLQQQHADMCEAQGPYSCRIISMTRTGDDEDEIAGELQLAVASDRRLLRGFFVGAGGEGDDKADWS